MRYELVMLAMQLAAFWPVWRWAALRAAGSPQGWLCVLPLAGAVAFAWRGGRRAVRAGAGLGLPAAMTVLYAATYAFVPPIVRALLAATAIACTLSRLRLGRRLHLGIWALCVLSLPAMPTAQFLLGWPLRHASTRMVAGLLRLAGLSVAVEGACLRWGSRLIAVDAPCSGVRMLWAGLCLVFVLACFYRLSARRTLAAAVAAVAAVLVGNTLRASSLFFLEAGIIPARAGLHAGVGLAAFAMTAGLIAWSARRIDGRRVCEPACT